MSESLQPVAGHETAPAVAEAEGDLERVPVCREPVFIIGSGRSATTALGYSLGAHPSLWSFGEQGILFGLFGKGQLDAAFDAEASSPFPVWFKVDDVSRRELVESVGFGLNALFTSRSGGRRWVDQSPVNTMIVDLLGRMFPAARFIHLLRDGREVVNSMVARGKTDAIEGWHCAREDLPGWATDFGTACDTWAHLSWLAADFATRNPSRSLTVRYERLVEDVEGTFADLLAFLEVPADERPASFFRRRRINSSFSGIPEAERRARGALDIWREWSLEQQLVFLERAGYRLFELGYAAETELAVTEEERYAGEIAAVVEAVVPNGLPVVLVGRAADAVRLEGREVRPFPAHPVPGYFPQDETAALLELDELRASGAPVLVLPRAASWWCDPYGGFREWLSKNRRALHVGDRCFVYDLSEEDRAG